MAQAFRIETLDRSGRWYLTPGSKSVYELRVRNDSKNTVDCSLVVEDPATGVSVEPNAFSLRGHEVSTITVTFAPDATSVRAQRVLLSLHADEDGRLLATFEHPLVVTGGTDCNVAMALKGPMVEAGVLRGFEMACSVRSKSEGRSTFQVSLSPHPAFAIPELPALSLEPGQVGEVVIPIRWDRSVRDNNGWNHPAIFELAVPVSNGRRTSRMRWELIEGKLELFIKPNGAVSSNGSVSQAQTAVTTEAARSATPQPAASQPITAPAPVAPAQAPAAPSPAPAAAPQAAPKLGASQTASIPTITKVPATTPNGAVRPLLMLNGHVEPLKLPAPVDAKPSAPSVANGVVKNDRVEAKPAQKITAPPIAAAAAPAAVASPAIAGSLAIAPAPATVAPKISPPVSAAQPAEVIELPLFAAAIAPVVPPVAPAATDGKNGSITLQPAAPKNGAPHSSQPIVTLPPAAKQDLSPKPAAAPKPAPALPESAVQKQGPATKVLPQTPTPASTAAASTETPTLKPAAPQWKIGSAEFIDASLAATPAAVIKAPVAPVTPAASVQAPVARPVAPAPAAASPAVDSSATLQSTSQSALAASAPKLTPYAPAKWDTAELDATSMSFAKLAENAAAAATKAAAVVSTPDLEPTPATRVIRERHTIEPVIQNRPRPGLLIGGLAAVAIIVGIFVFKPSAPVQVPSTSPVSVAPPVVAANSLNQTHTVRPTLGHKPARVVAKPNLNVKPTPNVTATPAPAATPKPATPAPAAAKPETQKPVVAARPAAPKHVSRYGKLYQPETGSVVAMGGIEAYYGPRGRAVRVIWSSAEQASANVQLIDNRGTTVNNASVRGGRQSIILYLPRGYRGALTVQVSSFGKLGEHVAQTTSLPPFGN